MMFGWFARTAELEKKSASAVVTIVAEIFLGRRQAGKFSGIFDLVFEFSKRLTCIVRESVHQGSLAASWGTACSGGGLPEAGVRW